MLFHNLNQIVRFFTEPYTVLLLGGGVFLLADFFRKRLCQSALRIAVVYLLFMLCWLVCACWMASSRYMMSLFVPGLLCIGYLSEKLSLHPLRLRGKTISAWSIVGLLLVALVIFSAGKLFRVSPKSLKAAGEALADFHKPGEKTLLFCNAEAARFQYYSGMETKMITILADASADNMLLNLQNRFYFFNYWMDAQYAAFILPSPLAEETVRLLEGGQFSMKLLRQMPLRTGKRKQILLMQWLPPHWNVEIGWTPFPLRNGDFSEMISEPWLKKRLAGFVGQGMPFFKNKSIKLPAFWNLYSLDSEAQAELKDTKPKFRIFARDYLQLSHSQAVPYAKGTMLLSFCAKGNAERMAVMLYSKKLKRFYPVAEISVKPQVQKYYIPLIHKDVPPEESVVVNIYVHNGEVWMDDVKLFQRSVASIPEQTGVSQKKQSSAKD